MRLLPPVLSLFCLVAVLAVPARKVAAQADTVPTRGTWGLRFALPDGGGGDLGATYFISDRTSFGIDLRFHYGSFESERTFDQAALEQKSERSGWGLGLRPEFRRYLRPVRGVVPFLAVSVAARYDSTEQDDLDRRSSWTTSARAGVGAEWLPVDRIGISGSTGISTSYRSAESDRESPRFDEHSSGWSVGIFRSALFLSFYF